MNSVSGTPNWPRSNSDEFPFDCERQQFTFSCSAKALEWFRTNELNSEWVALQTAENFLLNGIQSKSELQIAFERLELELHIYSKSLEEPAWSDWLEYLKFYGAKVYCPSVAIHMAELAAQKKTYKQGRSKYGTWSGNAAYQKLAVRSGGALGVNIAHEVETLIRQLEDEGKESPVKIAIGSIAKKYGISDNSVEKFRKSNEPGILGV